MNQSPPVNVTEKNVPLAGFWRRILACILDFILLGLAGLLLGILAGRYLALLSGFGPFVGFMVAVLYWGWFDSENGGGQTLGKKLCRLQVVSGDGQKLPLVSRRAAGSAFIAQRTDAAGTAPNAASNFRA